MRMSSCWNSLFSHFYGFCQWCVILQDCGQGFSTAGVTSGASTCTACSAGQFSESLSVNCTDCAAGRYSGNAASTCIDCAAGNKAVSEGTAVCEDCPGESFSRPASTTCDLCIADYYFTHNGDPDICGVDSSCCQCPEGAACLLDGGSTQEGLFISEGYWRINALSINVQACSWPKACAGGLNFTENIGGSYLQYCSEGYQGPLCGVCKPLEYYFDITTTECVPCGKLEDPWLTYSTSPTLIILSFLLIMALYFIYLSLCTITTSGNTSIAKQNERVRETRKIAKVAERMKEHKTKFKVRATNLND